MAAIPYVINAAFSPNCLNLALICMKYQWILPNEGDYFEYQEWSCKKKKYH